MKNKYQFQKCQKDDLPGVAKLVNSVFNKNFSIEYFEWKYFKSPAGKTISGVAYCDGHLVGLLGAVPKKFSIFGETAIGIQEVDVAILENHRNLSVYLNLVNLEKIGLKNSKIDFTYGVTINITSNLNETLFGKTNIGSIPRMVKIIDVTPYLKMSLRIGLIAKLLSPIMNSVLRIRYPMKNKVPENVRIQQIQIFDKRFNRFWEKIVNDYPIMIVRDAEYLNWRYVKVPDFEYEIYCIESLDEKDILGFMVLNVREEKFKKGYICDFITPKDLDSMVTRYFLKYAIKIFRNKKVASIGCWTFEHCHIYGELKKLGFMKRKKTGINLSVQKIPLGNKLSSRTSVINPGDWLFSRGDSDL